MMREYKYQLMEYLPFDYEGIEKRLEAMSLRGWRLVDIGAFLWKYRRMEPKPLHYSVVFLPKASQFDPEDGPVQVEYDDLCAAAGWQRVGARGKMVIYCSEEKDPSPIETDESIKLAAIRESLFSGHFLPLFLIIALLFLSRGLEGGFFNVPDLLSSYADLFSELLFCFVLLFVVFSLIFFVLWQRRSVRAIEVGGTCASTRRYGIGQKIGLVLICVSLVLFLISLPSEGQGGLILPVVLTIGALIAIIAVVQGISATARKSGVSRGKNRALTLILTFVLVFVVVAGLSGFMLWRELSLPDDSMANKKMPLTIEDIYPIGDTPYEYEWSHSHTIFLGHDYGFQCATDPEEDATLPGDLEYDIYYVKSGRLYDCCLKGLLHRGTGFENLLPGGHVDPAQNFQKEDDAFPKASVTYRYVDEDPEENQESRLWILCYPDRLIRLNAGWIPSPEERQIMEEKLLS